MNLKLSPQTTIGSSFLRPIHLGLLLTFFTVKSLMVHSGRTTSDVIATVMSP